MLKTIRGTWNSIWNSKKANKENSSINESITEAEGAEEIKKLGKIFEREKVDNTPFDIIGNATTGWHLMLGRYRLCEAKKTKEEVRVFLRKEMWNIMIQMIIAVSEMREGLNEKEKLTK